MYKRYLKILVVLVVIAIITFFIFKFIDSRNKSSDDLNSKIFEELNYLDSNLISILNDLNNLVLQNYIVEQESSSPVNQSNSESQSSSSDSSSSSNSSDKSSNEDSSNFNSNSSSSSSSNIKYKMKQNNIISSSKEPDWESLNNNIETLYETWSQIIIDLYKSNSNNNDILGFSNDINEAIKYIKAKDKSNCLIVFSRMYSYIPKFLSSSSTDEREINLKNVKSTIINAYSLIEEGNWNEIKNQTNIAEDYYNKVLNNIENNSNQYNVNKGYILLKEFQNSIDTNDSDVLLIKYKNLIEEINML